MLDRRLVGWRHVEGHHLIQGLEAPVVHVGSRVQQAAQSRCAKRAAEQALEFADAPWELDTGQRDFKNGYAYGVRYEK